MKYELCCIPSFDAKIYGMKSNVDDTPSNNKWNFSRSDPFKTLITQHQDLFPLIHTLKKVIWNTLKKKIVHQIHSGYITHPMH